ncbi:MAG: 4-hydroxy-tetrahydrodipicolinate reductase [bacterium]
MNIKKPKIALIGYGAMGKEIERISREKDLIITDIFEIDSKISEQKRYEFDVAIDFGYPEFVIQNVKVLSKLKKNIVIGTTAWYNGLKEVKDIVEENNIACIYGSNFSIGVQMFQRITELSAKLINRVSGYDIMLHELHHQRKKDSPSGTALSLAEIILNNVEEKKEIIADKCDDRISHKQLHVTSTRGGEIIGTHTVYMDSYADAIELTHRAKNRTGFAEGAISAAMWIHGKKGFYHFNDMLNDLWKDIYG